MDYDVVPPVVIDEHPALRELDEVIASAQRSSVPNTPEHFVDAAETFDFENDEEILQNEKITHVDRSVKSVSALVSNSPIGVFF